MAKLKRLIGNEAANVFKAAGAQVVEHGHLVAPGQKRPCEMTADKPGAAGDQYAHAEICPCLRLCGSL